MRCSKQIGNVETRKKTAEKLNTEFLQIVRQVGMDRKTPSDHPHLIGYYRKALEPRLSHKILFSNNVPKTIDGWMEKAIQFDTNWRMGSLFFNQDIKTNPSKQKADTKKSNGNAHWWRMNERKDPNAMNVDTLTMEERGMYYNFSPTSSLTLHLHFTFSFL
jgi:hypothetical protein